MTDQSAYPPAPSGHQAGDHLTIISLPSRSIEPPSAPSPAIAEQPPPPPHNSNSLLVTVSGVAGGVGTTTVAALLITALTARMRTPPTALDHTGGILFSRVVIRGSASAVTVHDLGVQTAASTTYFANLSSRTILVCTPHTIPKHIFRDAAPGRPGFWLSRAIIVMTTTSRHRSLEPALTNMRTATPSAVIIPVHFDPALALPCPIAPGSLSPASIKAADALVNALIEMNPSPPRRAASGH